MLRGNRGQQIDHNTGRVCHLVIFKSCLSSRQGTKAKQKRRIYELLLKVHGDKENADIIKKTKLLGAYPMPHLT
jgi:hypothetical protein